MGAIPSRTLPAGGEKRIWTRRRLLWLGIVAAVLLAVVAVSLLWQRGTFDGLRRSVIYARAEKDENGCAQLYQYAADRGVSVRVPVRVAGGGLQQPHPADG